MAVEAGLSLFTWLARLTRFPRPSGFSAETILAINTIHAIDTVIAALSVFARQTRFSVLTVQAILTIHTVDPVTARLTSFARQTRFPALAIKSIHTIDAIDPVTARFTRLTRQTRFSALAVLAVHTIQTRTAVGPVNRNDHGKRREDRNRAEQTSGDRGQRGNLFNIRHTASLSYFQGKNAHASNIPKPCHLSVCRRASVPD